MLAIVEELLARDLVVLDCVDTDFFEGDALAAGFERDFEGEVDGELVGAVEERTEDRLPPMVFWACQYSDFWMTGVLPAVCSPLASMDTMSGAYIACITLKFLPWSRNSTAVLSSTL